MRSADPPAPPGATWSRWLASGQGGVVVQVPRGLGRTGTILAAQRVHAGRSAGNAIPTVRAAIRHAIQAGEQEFVHRYEQIRAAGAVRAGGTAAVSRSVAPPAMRSAASRGERAAQHP